MIVASAKADGGATECEVLTRDSASKASAQTAQTTVLALLPVRDANASDATFSVQETVRGMVADFRLAMRVGTQYAPQGAWVISPWLTDARLQRSVAVNTPLPGVKAQADTEVHTAGVGFGLTRGLTRDTSLTLLLAHQNIHSDTTVTFPAGLPLPTQRSHDRQCHHDQREPQLRPGQREQQRGRGR